MKIINKPAGRTAPTAPVMLLLAAAALLVGFVLGNARSYGTFNQALARIERRFAALGPYPALPTFAVDARFENYNQILDQRQLALSQGVLFDDQADYVNADIRQADSVTPIRLRLLPGLAQHLEADDKWNLEIVTRDEPLPNGVNHAQLIDPSDNNWLAEWAFLQAVRHEGLLTGEYAFGNLIFNGENRGVYALQESIAPIIVAEDGNSHVVLSYDIDPLLEATARYGDPELALADPVSNLSEGYWQIAEIDEPAITEDELLSDQAQAATRQFQRWQSGDAAASEIFDVEKYGRFLALVDLWGAAEALVPANLHFAYDSSNGLLEPVATNGNPLRDAARLPAAALYQDPAIQTAYAEALAEFSDPTYLEELREKIGPMYDELARALAGETEFLDIWSTLAQRQEQLNLTLRPVQPVVAQLGSPELAQEAIIRIRLANTLNLPLELHGFDIDGATFLEADQRWIVDGEEAVEIDGDQIILRPLMEPQADLVFVTFDLPLVQIIQQDNELDFLNEIEVQVGTSILGLDLTQLTPARSGVFEGSAAAQP